MIPTDPDRMTNGVLERLKRALGAPAAERIAKDGLMKLGLHELRTADELLQFSNYLLKQGGVVESVGRALKVTAILHGARSD